MVLARQLGRIGATHWGAHWSVLPQAQILTFRSSVLDPADHVFVHSATDRRHQRTTSRIPVLTRSQFCERRIPKQNGGSSRRRPQAPLGRQVEVRQKRSGHRRGRCRTGEDLRPLHFVKQTVVLAGAVWCSDCLVAVSASAACGVDRPQPLRCCPSVPTTKKPPLADSSPVTHASLREAKVRRVRLWCGAAKATRSVRRLARSYGELLVADNFPIPGPIGVELVPRCSPSSAVDGLRKGCLPASLQSFSTMFVGAGPFRSE